MKGIVPELIVRQKAYDDMVRETLAFPRIETAWSTYGFILPGNKIYLAGVIPPSEDEIVRQYVHAVIGGKRRADAVEWLEKHAKLLNINPAKASFTYLSFGHSHHQLGLFEYSPNDINSIRENIEEDGLEVAIGPLSVIRGEKADTVAIKFYCYTRAMYEAGQRQPVVVTPRFVESLPDIPVPLLGWQFVREATYKLEIEMLKESGYDLIINEGQPPTLKVIVSKPEWNKGMVIIITPYDFPDHPPIIEVFPGDGREKADASHLWKMEQSLAIVVSKIEDSNFFAGGELPKK